MQRTVLQRMNSNEANKGLVNTVAVDIFPAILIQMVNTNDMLIWCGTNEEGRNQLNKRHEKKTKTRAHFALTFRK